MRSSVFPRIRRSISCRVWPAYIDVDTSFGTARCLTTSMSYTKGVVNKFLEIPKPKIARDVSTFERTRPSPLKDKKLKSQPFKDMIPGKGSVQVIVVWVRSLLPKTEGHVTICQINQTLQFIVCKTSISSYLPTLSTLVLITFDYNCGVTTDRYEHSLRIYDASPSNEIHIGGPEWANNGPTTGLQIA